MDRQERWTDKGPGEDPTLRSSNLASVWEMGSRPLPQQRQLQGSVPPVTVLSQVWTGISMSCQPSDAGQQSWDSHPWCYGGTWQVMKGPHKVKLGPRILLEDIDLVSLYCV